MTGTTTVATLYRSLYRCYEIRGMVTVTLCAVGTMTDTTIVTAWYRSLYQRYEIRGMITVTLRASAIYKWYQIGTTIFYEDEVASKLRLTLQY